MTMYAKEHVCETCGASGCKLWRYSNTYCVELRCATCAAKEEGEGRISLDPDGFHNDYFGRTDHIGNYVPAVPHPTGGWYTMPVASAEAGRAWQQLPNF